MSIQIKNNNNSKRKNKTDYFIEDGFNSSEKPMLNEDIIELKQSFYKTTTLNKSLYSSNGTNSTFQSSSNHFNNNNNNNNNYVKLNYNNSNNLNNSISPRLLTASTTHRSFAMSTNANFLNQFSSSTSRSNYNNSNGNMNSNSIGNNNNNPNSYLLSPALILSARNNNKISKNNSKQHHLTALTMNHNYSSNNIFREDNFQLDDLSSSSASFNNKRIIMQSNFINRNNDTNQSKMSDSKNNYNLFDSIQYDDNQQDTINNNTFDNDDTNVKQKQGLKEQKSQISLIAKSSSKNNINQMSITSQQFSSPNKKSINNNNNLRSQKINTIHTSPPNQKQQQQFKIQQQKQQQQPQLQDNNSLQIKNTQKNSLQIDNSASSRLLDQIKEKVKNKLNKNDEQLSSSSSQVSSSQQIQQNQEQQQQQKQSSQEQQIKQQPQQQNNNADESNNDKQNKNKNPLTSIRVIDNQGETTKTMLFPQQNQSRISFSLMDNQTQSQLQQQLQQQRRRTKQNNMSLLKILNEKQNIIEHLQNQLNYFISEYKRVSTMNKLSTNYKTGIFQLLQMNQMCANKMLSKLQIAVQNKKSKNIVEQTTDSIAADVFISRNPMQIMCFSIACANIYISLKKPIKAIPILKQCKRLSDLYRNQKYKMKCYKALSEAFLMIRKENIAEKFIKKYLQLSWCVKSEKNELLAYDMLGLLSYYNGDIEKAIFYHSRMANNILEDETSQLKKISFLNQLSKQKRRDEKMKDENPPISKKVEGDDNLYLDSSDEETQEVLLVPEPNKQNQTMWNVNKEQL